MYTKVAVCFALLPGAGAFLLPSGARWTSVSPSTSAEGSRSGADRTVMMAVATQAPRTQAKAAAVAQDEKEITLADVKGSNNDAVWNEVPEELYFVANYAAALAGDYPPDNVDKSYWDKIKPRTYEKLASLAKTADPTTISQAQYVILMEAIVRDAMAKDPKLQRPASEVPELTAQQEYVWNWINKIDNSEFLNWKKNNKLEDLTPEEWWKKIDQMAKENERKGLKLPEMTLDLTSDEFLGVAREEFVKSIKQFLQVESEMYPVFIITMPKSEEGQRMKQLFDKTYDIPTRIYEVYGFDNYKFKVKAEYDWGEARLQAIEELTGTKNLPVVYVGGEMIGGPEQVQAMQNSGALKKKVSALRDELVAMVEARYPKNEEESLYIGMRKVSPEEYKKYQDYQKKNGGLDPLEAKRQEMKSK